MANDKLINELVSMGMWAGAATELLGGASSAGDGDIVTATKTLTGVIEEQAAGIVITTHPGDIRRFGAKCDGKSVWDARIVAGTGDYVGKYIVTSATAGFKSSDVGKVSASMKCPNPNAKVDGFDHTVFAYISPTQVAITCGTSSVISASTDVQYVWGTDDGLAIEAATAVASTQMPKGTVFFPEKITCTTLHHHIPVGVTWLGITNVTSVMFAHQIRCAGSYLFLCRYLIGDSIAVIVEARNFVSVGLGVISDGWNGANIRNMSIDAMGLANYAVRGIGQCNHYQNVLAMRGVITILSVAGSGVLESSIIQGVQTGIALNIGVDTRVINNYVFGSGIGYPAIQVLSGDAWICGNHIIKDNVPAPAGELIYLNLYDGLDNTGAITIDANQFDTPVGANVRIKIASNTTIRCINIVNNHSIQNDNADNTPSAVINGTIVGTALTVNSISTQSRYGGTVTPKIYLGARLSGNLVHVVSQVSGTLGGVGVYTLSSAPGDVTAVAMNLLGYPYIELDIAAGSTLRMLNIVGNSGYGSYGDAAKGAFSSFVDATGLQGSLICCNVSDNTIDNCRLGYGAAGTGFAKYVPTRTSGNFCLPKNTDTVAVAF